MKVTLDIDKLLAEKQITEQEYHKLEALASRSASNMAFNILVGFGIIAVSAAIMSLSSQAVTAMILGLVIGATGFSMHKAQLSQWRILSNICILLGSLLFTGALIWIDEGSQRSFFAAAVILATGGIVGHNSLLIALSQLAIATTVGAQTGYYFASYFLGINEPTLTIVLFCLLSIGFYKLSKIVPSTYSPLAITAARTSLFMVNLGFWIASLWGDHFPKLGLDVPPGFFALLWAISLILAGIWGWKEHRAWVLNIAATFGGIHFYTQWFERLGATPLTLLAAGILALFFAITLRTLNLKMKDIR